MEFVAQAPTMGPQHTQWKRDPSTLAWLKKLKEFQAQEFQALIAACSISTDPMVRTALALWGARNVEVQELETLRQEEEEGTDD